MRYSLFPGGKRLRPLLAILGHRAGGGASGGIYPLSAACELVHTFTLIHDDLPCMDDDDLRRGRPTCHKVFGEATAVLAGDALLNLAYEVLAGLRCESSRKAALMSTLSRAVGGSGVLGGQVEDLEAEGRDITEGHLRRIHDRKTASLIRASLRMGAILAGAPASRVGLLDRYGYELGHLFQIVDDLLNVEGTEAALGRPAGGDERLQKASYPRILGSEATRRRIRKRKAAAMRAASAFVGMSPLFGDLVESVVARVRCTPGKEAVA
jgi:geranylgeranyl diphosphate synthase type II